jgi:hypothetical protein
MNRRIFLAIAWGVVASAISFWLNDLVNRAPLPQPWMFLLVSAAVEEITKYIGIRNSKSYSLAVPVTFFVLESAVQVFSPFSPNPFVAWVFSMIIGLLALKHILFYAPVYLLDCRFVSLPIAIALHALWNYYIGAPAGQDTLLFGLASIMIILLPAFALFKWGRDNG